ncbi:hypothetical protein [Micromonospora sp. NPDC005305]|uniref:hypothetical protein n=1 Tax=Micromonospora sp. NPDC005305 TaxID=3156875 RepID=UPI00339DF910
MTTTLKNLIFATDGPKPDLVNLRRRVRAVVVQEQAQIRVGRRGAAMDAGPVVPNAGPAEPAGAIRQGGVTQQDGEVDHFGVKQDAAPPLICANVQQQAGTGVVGRS